MKNYCKFCKNEIKSTLVAHNYNNHKNNESFFECNVCKVLIQPVRIDNLYDNQESPNYNLSKNFFYYLKQIILLNFIFNLKNFFNKKQDILDYGCGSGELAIAMSFFFKKKNIFTADVFYLEKKFIPKIKKHFLIQSKELKVAKFDLIILRHVFEHVFDLKEFVNDIKNNLKNKNSYLLIEVPNMDSFWRKIMKKRWPGYFYPYHYYVFSKLFLKNFFSRNGFEVVKNKDLEPPIIGSYLLTYGVNKSICKILSIIFYPIQILVSKLFSSSESILLVLKLK